MCSGDDVGDQLVFQPHDLILERQLLLFQPLQGQLVGRGRDGHGLNGKVQITMVAPHHLQADADHLFDVQFGRGIHGWLGCPVLSVAGRIS